MRGRQILSSGVARAAQYPWRTIAVLFGLLTSTKALIALSMSMPVTWGDSFLYLSRARNLARLGLPVIDNICGPDYPPMYSLLLAPAYLFGSDPQTSYQSALILNSLIGSTLLIPCFLLSREITGKAGPALLIAAMASGMPVPVGYSLSIMSENLFLPLFALLCWLVLRYRELRPAWAVLAGLTLGLLILTKALAWALVPGALVLAVGAAIEAGPERRRRALQCGLLLLGAILIPVLAWEGWDHHARSVRPLAWAGGYDYDSYWGTIDSVVRSRFEATQFTKLGLSQLGYVFISSFALAGAAFIGTLDRLLRDRGNRTPWLVWAAFGTGILALGTLHSLTYFRFDPERYQLFGRYVDAMIPVGVSAGAAMLLLAGPRLRLWTCLAALMALAAVLSVPYEPTIWLHRSGFFFAVHLKQWVHWRFLCALLLVPILSLWLLSGRRWARLAILSACAALALVGSAEIAATLRNTSQSLFSRHELLVYVRENFRSGDRILIDANEFEKELCFSPVQWMLMYQTETLPVVTSDWVKLPGATPGAVSYLLSRSDHESLGLPVATFRGLHLYRLGIQPKHEGSPSLLER